MKRVGDFEKVRDAETEMKMFNLKKEHVLQDEYELSRTLEKEGSALTHLIKKRVI